MHARRSDRTTFTSSSVYLLRSCLPGRPPCHPSVRPSRYLLIHRLIHPYTRPPSHHRTSRLNTYNSGARKHGTRCIADATRDYYQGLIPTPAPAPGSSDGRAGGSAILLLLACRPWQLHMASAQTASVTRLRCDVWFSPADKFQLLWSRLSSSTDGRNPFCQRTRRAVVFSHHSLSSVLRYRSNMGKVRHLNHVI